MNQLTEAQKEMFKTLSTTGTGKELAAFLDALCNELCDIRNISTLSEEAKRSRLDMVSLMQREVIARIRLFNPNASQDINPYA